MITTAPRSKLNFEGVKISMPSGFGDPGHLSIFEAQTRANFESALADIMGFDRGYNQEADVLRETVDGTDLNGMWREFQASLRLFNAERDALLNFFTFDVANPTETVYQPSAEEDFEEASEFGEPKGIRLGRPFKMGYSFKWWDIGARYTWKFLAEATAAQVESINATVLESGNRLYFSQVMRRLFNPANEVASIDGENVNVYALYNNDGTVPPAFRGTTFLGTHTHYLASGAATIDPGDINDLEDHLYHHGYRVTLGYRLVLMLNRAEASIVRTFVAGTAGARWTFIPNQNTGGGIVLPQNGGIIGQPGGSIRGQIGTYGPFLVVEEDYVPAGYVVAFATGGEQNIGNLIGIRQHSNRALRGLQLVKGRDQDYPLTDSFYRFGFGTGVRHRGAGVVMQVTTNPTYTAPALYV